jgi:hypothetical protein
MSNNNNTNAEASDLEKVPSHQEEIPFMTDSDPEMGLKTV